MSIVVVTVSAVLLFAPFFNVRRINIERRDPRIDPGDIQQTLSPLFNQRLVLITKAQVATMLNTVYPDITAVSIGKEYPSTLSVSITLEPVVAEITMEESGTKEIEAQSGAVLAGTGATQYAYITTQGTYVTSPIRLTKEKLEKLVITDWGILPQNRTRLLTPDTLRTIFLARDTLRRDFGLQPMKIIVYLRAQEFHIKTPKGTLWFDERTDLPMQFQRFREFLKEISLDQVKEYIDLRIADKIVYK
jgi:hypothetical protein